MINRNDQQKINSVTIKQIPVNQSLFNKPQIIAMMKTALRRLRKDKITIEQVIEQIEAQGVEMSRTRFEDLFTTRPHRMNGASPQVLIATIHALFQLKNNVLNTQEVIELATATRLPINMLGQIVEYFNIQERQEILRLLPTTRKVLEKRELIGRDSLFAQLYMYMQSNTNLVISGEQGIGKTALAYALIREYEIHYHTRIPSIQMTTIPTSQKDVFEIIATAFAIKPLYQEPIELRINSILKSSQIYYVLLDNYPESHDNAHQIILKMVLQRLPMLRVIITSRRAHQFSQINTLHEETLTPLIDIDHNSPAYQLFKQVLQANGTGVYPFSIDLLKKCQLAQGNPFNIMVIANIYANTEEYRDTNQAVVQLMASLSTNELHIVEFIALCRQRITLPILQLYMHQIGMSEIQLHDTIKQLVARKIIFETIINEVHAYSIHDVLMLTLLQLNNQVLFTTQKISLIIRRLISIIQPLPTGTMPILTREDVVVLINLAQYVLEINDTHILYVMKFLVEWELVWVHYASTVKAIMLAEQCLEKYLQPHPIVIKLYSLLGNLHHYRSNNEQARYYFEKAITHFLTTGEKKEWALVVLDYSYNLGRTTLPSEQIVATHTAITIFHEHDMHYASARGYDCLSRIYLQNGDIKTALRYSQLSINGFAGMTDTVGYIDALIHKALLYMVTSDYEIARQLCLQVIHISETNHWTHLNATAKLRIAGIFALEGNHYLSRYYLAQSADILLRLGNTGEILFVVDVYSFILLIENRISDALQYNDISTLLRIHLNLPRGPVLEALVQSKRESVFVQRNNIKHTPLTQIHDIYEVINMIRTELS